MEDWVRCRNIENWCTTNNNAIRKAFEETLGRTSVKME
jgi:hypothetical protein